MKTCRVRSSGIYGNIKRAMVAVLAMLIAFALMTTISVKEVYAADTTPPDIGASSAVVMSLSTGQVVYSLHSDRKLPAGATAQLMTVLTTIRKMHDLKEMDNNVEITSSIAKHGTLFKEGDSVSVRNLMYAVLLEQSEEAAYALAIYSSGKESTFVNEMNSLARELGMVGTHYENSTGSYKTEQYSTAADTAKLAAKAYRYKTIRHMSSQKTKTITTAQKTVTLKNINPLMSGSYKCRGIYAGCYGILSRPDSHSVYIGAASRDDMEIVVVIMEGNESSTAKDAKSLIEYGYKTVDKKVIIEAGQKEGHVFVRHGERTIVPVYTAAKGYVYIPEEGSSSLISTKKVIYKHVKAPLHKGQKVGEYRIYVADEYEGSVDLVVRDDIGEGWFPSYIYISNAASTVILILMAAFFVTVLRLRHINKKRKKLKEKKRREKIRELARKQKEIEDDRIRRNWTYK
jgi:D-alanyl-D-alanine carboxypeptidase (penicillin-binding protein 5/6)